MGAFWDIIEEGDYDVPYVEKGRKPKESEPPSLWERFIGEFTGANNRQQDVPQDLSQYYDADVTGAFGGSDYEQPDNQIATGSPDLGNKFTEALNRWGDVAAQDLGKVLYAQPGEEFANAVRSLYNDALYEPAIGVASTPFAPAPVRVGAGLLALPGFLSDVAGMYSQNLSGEATGEEQGPLDAAWSTVRQGLIDPAVNAAGNIISDPSGFAERVGENPLNLWSEAFIPLAPGELAVRGGRGVYNTAKGIKNLGKDIDALGEDYINAPDNQMGGRYAEEAAAADRAQRKLEESQQRAAYVEQGIAKQQARDLVNQRLQDMADSAMARNLEQDFDSAYGEPYAAPQSDFDAWFEGMAQQESGGRYDAVNSDTGASGRYQIMPENWDAWAEEAGLERGSEMTPENQDIVARHKMRGYYDEYGPDGALVAWYAGPENAKRWVNGEATDVWGNPWDKPQSNGPSIADYVREATEKGQENGLEPLTEKYYNITDEVSDTALTDLTEQKLNYLARDYAERYGENLDLTSMKRSGDGSSWHDSGQAFDIANERLAKDAEARAWLMERAKEYGLVGLDEYTNPSAHATGGHLHFSDHGEPLKGAGRGRGYEPSGYRDDGRAAESSSQSGEMTDAFGRDFSGNESLGRVQESMGKLDEQINRLKTELERTENDAQMNPVSRMQQITRLNDSIAKAEEYRAQMNESLSSRMQGYDTGEVGASAGGGRYGTDSQMGNVPGRYRANERARAEAERQQAMADDMAQRINSGYRGEVGASAGGGRAARDTYLDDVISRTKDKRSADIEGVRQYRDALSQEVDRMVDMELAHMEANPGGRGTNNQLIYDEYDPVTGKPTGNVVGRSSESMNPQWYQDFYRENGRKPNKGEYAEIAYKNLMKNQEFAEMDRNLRRADEYLKRFEENPMLDADAMMEDVDNLIQYDRAAKAGRKEQQRAEVESLYDEEAKAQGMPEVQLSQKGGRPNPPAGGKGTETITNKDYFDRMRELWGTLRLGRLPKDANGIYNGATDVARANHWGNYDTMWHEIGHRMDAKLDLSAIGNNHPQEMEAALRRKYGNNIPYQKSQYTAEGIAEFVKDYVNDPAKARQEFPGFSKDFERVLSRDKDLAAKIKESQDMARTYREQPTGAKIAGGIVKDEPKTFKQKVTDFLHDFMQNWVDDKQGIKRAEKEIEKIIGRKLSSDESAYIYSRIAKDRGVSAATQMLTGKDPQAVKDALNKLYGGCVKNAVTLPEVVKSLEDVAKDSKDWMEAQGLKDANEALSAYTIAQRFMEVYDLKYSNPLAALKDKLSQAEADLKKAEAAEAQAKAKLKGSTWNTGKAQAQRDYDAAHKAAVAARKAQRAAAHAVAEKEEMGYKMPLEYEEYHEFVDNAPEALKKAAQGVYDLNENVVDIMHHEGIISDEVHKYLKDNHKHYVSLARDFPDDANIGKESFAPSPSFVNVGTPLKKLSEEGSFRDVKDPMQQMAKNIFNAMSLVERNKVGKKLTDLSNLQGVGGVVEKVAGDASTKDSTFYVWRNGKKEVYATTPEIYNALKSFKPESIDGMMKYLGELPARWMRAGAVVYNPAFVAKNAFRDQFTAYLFSEYGYKPFWDMAKGIYHILKKDELYQEFKTSGTLMSTIVNAAKDYSGELLKDAQRTPKEKVFRRLNPLANLEALSNYAEMGTRMGLYAKARKSGASIIDATMEAREGTLDFGKAGIKGRAANRYMPFFNATIQDTALLFEKFKKNPARMAQRLAPMVLGSLALYAFIRSHDDLSKEYDELMPYERNMFWNVPVPKAVCETGWLRFPKPFGPGFLFGSLPERLADLTAGHDKSGKQMKEWATGYLGSLVPGAMPPLVQAGVEWGSGYSFFRERDIVPAREKGMKAPDQYGPDTSHFAKWAGEQTGLSPRKIDNLGQNLFAGAYGGVTSLHDAATGEGKKVNMPWETLKLDPWRSPQSTQDYYDRRNDVREAQNSFNKRGREMSYEDKHDYKLTTKIDQKLQKKNEKLRRAQEEHDDEAVRELKREIAEMLDYEMEKFEKR